MKWYDITSTFRVHNGGLPFPLELQKPGVDPVSQLGKWGPSLITAFSIKKKNRNTVHSHRRDSKIQNIPLSCICEYQLLKNFKYLKGCNLNVTCF